MPDINTALRFCCEGVIHGLTLIFIFLVLPDINRHNLTERQEVFLSVICFFSLLSDL